MSGASFGGILRGRRLGYAWSEKYGCFVRISGGGPFCVEVAPGPIPPTHPVGGKQHWCWWEGEKGESLLDMIGDLPSHPARVIVLYVGEHGERVS